MTTDIDLVALHKESFERASPATTSSLTKSRRMRPEMLTGFLERKQYLVLSSTRKDGRPHSAMSAYLLDGGRFWCPTMGGTVRTRNLRRDPRVSLIVTEGEGAEHAMVKVEGDVELLDYDAAPDGLEERWDAKFGWRADWAQLWIVATPNRVLSYADTGWTL